MEAVTHWDDLAVSHHELGPMDAHWRTADGVRIGMSRIEVAPGKQSTPAHEHTGEEELFYVLAGSGLWWQDGATTAIGAGDVCFAKPGAGAHTIIGGDDGIDVLAFGPRHEIEVTHLPRPGVLRIGGVATVRAERKHQWFFESEAGPVERAEPGERPPTITRLLDIPTEVVERPGWEMTHRWIGPHLGAVTTGMSHFVMGPGAKSFPFHCHSAEEELFVVLDGDGTLRLGDDEIPVRPGSVVSRPAGTRIAHAFRAGPRGLTYLAYSDRVPDDAVLYPERGVVLLAGLGVTIPVVEER